MEEIQIPTYVKINKDVKDRATMYITKSKLLNKNTNTMTILIEEALDQYMIQHPL